MKLFPHFRFLTTDWALGNLDESRIIVGGSQLLEICRDAVFLQRRVEVLGGSNPTSGLRQGVADLLSAAHVPEFLAVREQVRHRLGRVPVAGFVPPLPLEDTLVRDERTNRQTKTTAAYSRKHSHSWPLT